MKKVIFICTGNACRSQMAEGFLNYYKANKYEVYSAGTNPTKVHPAAIKVMSELKIDISNHTSDHMNDFLDKGIDIVIGAKGSPLQIVLSSIYHIDVPTGNIPLEEVEKFITTYYEFPGNFTTNLRGSRKFLQAGIGVSTQYDDNVITHVEDHQLSLRSSILAVMSEFSEQDIEGKSGRDALAKAIAAELNSKLEDIKKG